MYKIFADFCIDKNISFEFGIKDSKKYIRVTNRYAAYLQENNLGVLEYYDCNIGKQSVDDKSLIYYLEGLISDIGGLKTSEEWMKNYSDIVILDPDGWDRRNFQFSWYEEKITLVEFEKRLVISTITKK